MIRYKKFLSQHSITFGLSALLFLLSFRGYYALKIFSEYDDACYFRKAVELFKLTTELPFKSHSCAPGTAFIWGPIVVLSKFGELLSGYRLELIAPPLIGLFSFFSFAIAAVILGEILTEQFPRLFPEKFWGLIFGLLTPILFYISHRTTLAHSVEFLVVSIFLWAFFKKNFFLAFAMSLLAVLTRYNDFPIFFIFVAMVLERKKTKVSFIPLFLAMAIFSIAGAALVFSQGYAGISFGVLAGLFTFKSLFVILVGLNFGLLWTAPLWLLSFALGIRYFYRLSYAGRVCLFWMMSLIILQMSWGGFGSSFGYRYLLGSYICIVILVRNLREYLPLTVHRKKIRIGLLVHAVWISALFWLFQTTPGTTLWLTENGGFDNRYLILNTIKLLASPVVWLRPVALSPVPSVFYSLFFPSNEAVKKYVLSGPSLWLLSFATVVAIVTVVMAIKTWSGSVKKGKL